MVEVLSTMDAIRRITCTGCIAMHFSLQLNRPVHFRLCVGLCSLVVILVITMDSQWLSTLEEQERERLRLKRKQWRFQQDYEKKHEERKKKMIEEYERKRATEQQQSSWQSKSSSPQGRETSFHDYKYSKKKTVIDNGTEIDKDVAINKKKLEEIKIRIKNENFRRKDHSTSQEQDIIPRRRNEGACPIFQRSKIKTEEKRTITFSRNEQLVSEKQSTNGRNIYKKLDTIQHNCSYKSTIERDDRYNCDRKRSPTRGSKEKNKDRSEKRDRSSSHYRSRSHSPISERTERKADNDTNKFPSKRSYPVQPRELDNRVLSKLNNPFSNNVYNSYVYLPRLPMPGMAPPILMPIFPGLFRPPFPVYNWRPPHNRIHQWQKRWNPRIYN